MLTWLDRYVRDAARYFKAHCSDLYPEIKQRYPWADNDVGLTGLLSFHRYAGGNVITGLPIPNHGEITTDPHKAGMYLAVIPFCVPRTLLSDISLKPPRAIQPAASLLEDFKGARPPKGTEHLELLHNYSWYIDVPHESLLHDQQYQVRCLFVTPLNKKIHVLAVMTRPNSNEMCAVASGAPFEMASLSGQNTPGSFTSEALENLADLVSMLLLYSLHPHPGTKVELPYFDPRQLASMKPNKAKTKLHSASMFRVVRLDSPPDRFGRPPEERQGRSWKLKWRVQVSGYYRWQPWGAKQSNRRWQYVKGYERGPEIALSKTELTQLKS